MSFLTAEWRKLAMANYAIDPAILAPYVPPGTELDSFNGKHFVSLIGFMFLNTRVLGVKVPFHVNFEEVNLRFYVRYNDDGDWKRGVVFIKEIVPKAAITFVANTLYGEHYVTLPMRHRWADAGETREVGYEWKLGGRWQHFSVKADLQPTPIAIGSEEEFITEHYWGYTKTGDSTTTAYEVTHPRWEQYPVQDYRIDVDFGENYGREFSILDKLRPTSVLLAEGSEITVEGKQYISL